MEVLVFLTLVISVINTLFLVALSGSVAKLIVRFKQEDDLPPPPKVERREQSLADDRPGNVWGKHVDYTQALAPEPRNHDGITPKKRQDDPLSAYLLADQS